MSAKFRIAAALALVVSMFTATMSASAFHEGSNQYHEIEREEFEEVWERTDRPVAETEVARTWIWGPAGFSDLMVEEYDDADDGEREVQYFDKSRMEMPRNGEADEDSPWFITQGRLAYELMTGNLQLGDEEEDFEQHQPSQRSAAGDPVDDTAPTYAAMGDLMDRDARAGEEVIVEYANRQGATVEDEDRFAGYGITDVEGDWQDVEGIDKNIASVFWDFMNSDSIIYDADQDAYVNGKLFLNAFYAVGYPLTDAFWADVTVGGDEQEVLIQCFERRCLTYTPGNPGGWEVESGNIGQHYYNWRYHEIDRDAPTEGTFTFDGETSVRIDVDGEVVLTAHVTSHGDDVEGAPVYFHVIGGDESAVSLSPDQADTGADGTADVTVTGESDGTAEVHAFVDVNGNGEYDFETDLGLGLVEVTVGPALPDISLNADGMNVEVGEIGTILSSLNNPIEDDGGLDHDNVRNRITVDGPVDCDDNGTADWADWFQVTDINDSGSTQGINDTFECDEDTGNFVGFWGPEAGFELDAGVQLETTFEVMVAGTAPVGAYTATVEVIDLDGDVVLATASDDFDILAEDDNG